MKQCIEEPTNLAKYLVPVERFGEEKHRLGMYDDWDEPAHTRAWLAQVFSNMQVGSDDRLFVYYLEEKGCVIGSVFVLVGSKLPIKTMADDGVIPEQTRIAHLTCFHILQSHRGTGLGSRLLKEEILPDLRTQGIREIYIKSSHYGAFSLYERFGTQVGTYVRTSDHRLYQRLGRIYRISL